MRPKLLKIKGINSFLEEQTIDFDALTQGGIFGIFGPTGSGKSTILDGITLALYGNMARKSSNLINVNLECASVIFEFSMTETKTKTYRASREYLRDKEGKIRTGKCQLLEFSKGEVQVLAESTRMMTETCEKIIGLGWEDFSRTVVLPQGKFSEFLKLQGRERRDMLERLFNLSEFGEDLSRRLKKESDQEKKALNQLEGQLKAYEEISLKQLQERSEAWEKTSQNLKNQETQLKVLSKSLDEKKHLWDYQEEMQKILKDVEALKKEDSSEKKLQLEAAKKATGFLSPMEALERSEKEISDLKKELSSLEKNRDRKQMEWAENEKKYHLIDQEKNEDLPKLIEALPKTKEAIQLLEEKKELDQQIASLIKKCDQSELNLKCQRTSLKEREEASQKKNAKIKMDERQEKELRISPLHREKISQGEKLEEKIKALKKDLNKNEKEVEGIQEELNQIKEIIKKIKEEEKTVKKKQEENKDNQERQEKDKPKTRAKIQTLKDENFSLLLRAKLSEGKPCPVCGSTHHFPPKEESEVLHPKQWEETIKIMEESIELWERKNKALEMKKNALEKEALMIEGNLKTQKQRLDFLEKQADKINQESQKIKKEAEVSQEILKNLSQEVQVKDFKKEIKQGIEMAVQREALLGALEKKRFDLEEDQRKIQALQEEISKQKEGLSEEKTRCDEKKEQQIKWQETIEKRVGKDKTIEGLNKLQNKLTMEIKRIQELWEKLNKNREDLKTAHQKASEKTLSEKAVLESKKEQAKNAQTTLLLQLKTLGFASWEEAKKACLSLEEMKSLEKWIKKHEETELKLCGKLEELQEKMAGKTITKEAYQELKKQWEMLTKDEENLKKKETQLEIQIQQLKEQLEEKKILVSKKEKQEKQLGLIIELERLFLGKKFVEFVAMSRLTYIALEASKRLSEITYGKYALKTDANGQFIMIDKKNGGEERDPSTLSGGETFLASLALALALSSEIQLKGTAPLEFFFLDEGFGSLHEDALDVVMTCIESLHHEKLKIGIISHVESIKNRMPVKLILIPGEAGGAGSRVRIEK